MKVKELREKGPAELAKTLEDSRKHLAVLRFDVSARQHKNHREIRSTKKTISRILTIVQEKKQ